MALSGVYQALGVERPDAVSWAMWKRRHQEEAQQKERASWKKLY